MSVERSRIQLLMGTLAVLFTPAAARRARAAAAPLPAATVYKSPT